MTSGSVSYSLTSLTATNVAVSGYTWTTPQYAILNSNTQYAIHSGGDNAVTDILLFTINAASLFPVDVIVTGVEVTFRRARTGGNDFAYDYQVQLRKSGTSTGYNIAAATADWQYYGGSLPPNWALDTYGNYGSTWGAVLTPAEINAGDISLALRTSKVKVGVTGPDLYVSNAEIEIFYDTPMAKITSKNAIILYNGYNLSSDASVLAIEEKQAAEDVTGFGEGGQNFTPGLLTSRMTLDVFWDTTAGKSTPVLKALSAPPGYLTVIPEGYAIGRRSLSLVAMQVNFDPRGSAAGSPIALGTIQFESNGSGPGLEMGEALHHGVITATTTGAAVADVYDISGATTALSAATLQVWTDTATDTYVVKVQTSDDGNTSWGDWITFTLDGTAIGAQRVEHASGAVKAYRRIVATRTGAAADPFGFTVTFWRSA